LLGALVLKDNPNETLRNALEHHRYPWFVLPADPYLKG
jgi:hypothetical protein